MDWLNISVINFQYFIIIFARMMSIVSTTPVLGSAAFPMPAKIGLSMLTSFIVFPLVARNFPALPDNVILYFIIIIKECAVGILIGMIGFIIFAGIQLAGQIFGMQIGFGIVNVIDPLSEMQVSIISQFQFMLAILIFLSIDGHYFFISSIVRSYELVSLNAFTINGAFAEQIIQLLQKTFVIGLKIGMPMIASLMLLTVAMGLVARTVPQINVFIVGLPLNILVGLGVLIFSLSIFTYITKGYIEESFKNILFFLRIAGGG